MSLQHRWFYGYVNVACTSAIRRPNSGLGPIFTHLFIFASFYFPYVVFCIFIFCLMTPANVRASSDLCLFCNYIIYSLAYNVPLRSNSGLGPIFTHLFIFASFYFPYVVFCIFIFCLMTPANVRASSDLCLFCNYIIYSLAYNVSLKPN